MNVPGPFIIDYTTALNITALSGEIWDIDGSNSDTVGTESWRVEVLDAANSILATQDSPVGTLSSNSAPLDGKPWTFGFTGLTGIDKVRITFTGTKTSGIGLAFNNFSPTTSMAVPEPMSLSTGIVAVLVGLGIRLRHKRK